jgi:hypothetical protein
MAKPKAPACKSEQEIWKEIPMHDGYEVSSVGRMRSVDRILSDGRSWKGRIMRTKIDLNGYVAVSLSLGEKGKYRYSQVHRLIAEAFHGAPPSPDHQVAHWDGVRANNVVDNIRWATALENAVDRDRHGNTAHLKGELHGQAKLTDDSVRAIRQARDRGVTLKELADHFDVAISTVCEAASGKTWGHI